MFSPRQMNLFSYSFVCEVGEGSSGEERRELLKDMREVVLGGLMSSVLERLSTTGIEKVICIFPLCRFSPF